MPYFKIETNRELDDVARETFLSGAARFAANLLGKPEESVMVSLMPTASMRFQANENPCAYVEFKSIGLSREKCPEYAKAIGEYLESALGIAPQRSYIEFTDIDPKMFGWDKSTF
jgi:phenylpyruvate tautomerase PptA (4-oxalocrotonate tautomerase family)